MRIVHVLGTLAAGGAERFVVSLACELRRKRWDVGMVIAGSRTDPTARSMAEELAAAGVPVLTGPTPAIRLRAILWYLGQMRRLRAEIVHLHNINTESVQMFVPPPWRPRRGLVRTVHNSILDTKDMDGFSLRTNEVAFSVFCSEASLERTGTLVRGPRRVIPYGVRMSRPIRTPQASRAAKERLGLAPKRVHFVHVGRMSGDELDRAQKAHDVLIRAWLESGLGQANGVLHLLGDGTLHARLAGLAAGDPSVVFHGVRSDVGDWLLAADCFVLPSRWEGLPVAGIEAVTAGLPCLFTRIAPLLELRPPVAAWSEVDDVAGLAHNLAEFAAAPAEVGVADVEETRKRFGIARVAEQYEEIYRSLGSAPGVAA